MNKLLTTTFIVGAVSSWAGIAAAQDCGTISLAMNNVQSAEVLTQVDIFILENGFGCSTEIIPGDTVPTTTSMVEKGAPDVSSETWVDLVPEVIPRGLSEGKIVMAAAALPDGGIQGWFVPKYLVDAHPEIKTVEDALAHPELFANPDEPGRGQLFNGSEGWGGTVVTTQLFKAYDAEAKGFSLVAPGSSAALDGLIARAYDRQESFITYYWSPTSVLGKYPMVMLEEPAGHDMVEWKRCITNLDCADPKPMAWPVDKVMTVVTSKFATEAPAEVIAYFNTRGWSNATVNALMSWQTENQATGVDGALHFLEGNRDIWSKWVSPEVAAKVEAAL